jgi:transposase
MSIDHQIRSRILVEFHENGKNKKEIAAALGVDEATVEKVITLDSIEKSDIALHRPQMITPFLPYIREKLEETPKIPASALWRQCTELGYPGKQDHFRALISEVRPRKQKEAFLRTETLQGEQAQVDWGIFGKIAAGKSATRQLSCFVMVLSYSRRTFAMFFQDQKQSTLQKAHNLAFQYFGGVPRKILYDNMKSVVLSHKKNEIRFNQDFLKYAKNLSFEPFATNVRSPEEKGKVERTIRYIRNSFFIGRKFDNIDHLNQQLQQWLIKVTDERKHQTEASLTVKQAWALERRVLRPIPAHLPPPTEEISATVSKTCYVQYDTNFYSVPTKFSGEDVVIIASHDDVQIMFGDVEIARHRRSWNRKYYTENPEHFAELRRMKEAGRTDSTKAWLAQNTVNFEEFLKASNETGANTSAVISHLGKLAHKYSLDAVDSAMAAAYTSGRADIATATAHLEFKNEENSPSLVTPMELSFAAQEAEYVSPSDPLLHFRDLDL